MLPEHFVATVIAIVLGWGGISWNRTQSAVDKAKANEDKIGQVELKLAERYLTKEEFESQMERLFHTLSRFEEKLDYHVFSQAENVQALRDKLRRSLD